MCIRDRSCEVVSTGEIGTQPLYLAASVTGCTYVSTSSQLAWCRTVSLGTYWYCCGGVLVYTYSSTACTVNSLRWNKFHQFIISLLQVIRDLRMYIPHSSPGGVLFPWARTGTAAAVYSYRRTCLIGLPPTRSIGFLTRSIPLPVKLRAVWGRLIQVQQKPSCSPTMTS